MNPLNQGVLHWFQAQHSPALDLVMVNLTDLGERYVVTLVGLVAVVCFLVGRQYRTALLILATTLAAWGLGEAIKNAVKRPRPAGVAHVHPSLLTEILKALPQPTHAERSYSFPSNHALVSAAIYGSIALMVARRLRPRWARRLVVGGAALLVFVIGITRLYLGAHYLSDVLAGWALGLICALVCGWLDARWATAPAGPADSRASGT